MNELEKQWGFRAPEKLRSKRMAEPLRTEESDSRLKKSAGMVDGRIRGLAENQRRVRYFGFETTHEQTEG